MYFTLTLSFYILFELVIGNSRNNKEHLETLEKKERNPLILIDVTGGTCLRVCVFSIVEKLGGGNFEVPPHRNALGILDEEIYPVWDPTH